MSYKPSEPSAPTSYILMCASEASLVVNDDDDDDDDEANFGSSIRMKLLYVIGGVLT